MQQYYKEFATVNGNIVKDKEIKTITNDKEKITMGHDVAYPIFMKEMIEKTKRKRKTRKQKNKSKKRTISNKKTFRKKTK
jgi:hypothetical protein